MLRPLKSAFAISIVVLALAGEAGATTIVRNYTVDLSASGNPVGQESPRFAIIGFSGADIPAQRGNIITGEIRFSGDAIFTLLDSNARVPEGFGFGFTGNVPGINSAISWSFIGTSGDYVGPQQFSYRGGGQGFTITNSGILGQVNLTNSRFSFSGVRYQVEFLAGTGGTLNVRNFSSGPALYSFPPVVPPPPPPGAIPEPGTWAMLIAGFGVVGASLRRRRVVAA